MSRRVCSYYSSLRKLLRRPMFAVLVGGVLLSLALALVPNNSYADSNISSDITFTTFDVRLGCNVVNSFSGFMAIGPRGSITGADNNPSGCNYYFSNGSLSWRSNSDYYTNSITYDLSGDYYYH